MILILGHSDTVRINAEGGSTQGLGSQYFWLSKDSHDFFPPLTLLNERGYKTTNSCLINLYYVDIGIIERNTRVTFEIGNNVDFRLGTGKYRYTRLAQPGDMAALSRLSEYNYEIRIFRQGTSMYNTLLPYATSFIGIRDKRIGYINNDRFERETGISLSSNAEFNRMITQN